MPRLHIRRVLPRSTWLGMRRNEDRLIAAADQFKAAQAVAFANAAFVKAAELHASNLGGRLVKR